MAFANTYGNAYKLGAADVGDDTATTADASVQDMLSLLQWAADPEPAVAAPRGLAGDDFIAWARAQASK